MSIAAWAGAFALVACAIWTITELAMIRTIRPPARQTFLHMRLVESQYQSIIVSAFSVLVTGMLLSLSAAYIFQSITVAEDDESSIIGIVLFFLAAISLLLALLLGGRHSTEDPENIAHGPFTIRAAADEYAADPRTATVDPEVLQRRLDRWEENIAIHALNASHRAHAKRKRMPDVGELQETLDVATRASGVWAAIWQSALVYVRGLRIFPWRLTWPAGAFVLFTIGVAWGLPTETGIGFEFSELSAGARVVLIVAGLVVIVASCITRGNRARLWHRVNVQAVVDAREAVVNAQNKRVEMEHEREQLKRVIGRIDSFFGGAPSGDDLGQFRVLARLGSIEVRLRRR